MSGLDVGPPCSDAVIAMQLLEHALRPLSHPPVRADVMHAVTNGLGALPALAAKWRYGPPVIVTEHGVYMREHYLHLRHPQFGWPVKDLYLRFLRRLCTLGYQEAESSPPATSTTSAGKPNSARTPPGSAPSTTGSTRPPSRC